MDHEPRQIWRSPVARDKEMEMNRTLAALRTWTLAVLVVAVACSPALAQKKSKGKAAAPSPYQTAIDGAFAKFKDLKEGKNADYIPALAEVDPNIYGIALVTTDGKVYTTGDITSEVSIQSISKVF